MGKRAQAIKEMSSMGIPAFIKDIKAGELDGSSVSVGIFHSAEVRTMQEIEDGVELSLREERERGVYLTGTACAAIEDIKPARVIVEDMVAEACEQLKLAHSFVVSKM